MENIMKKFILQLGKKKIVCYNVEKVEKFVSGFRYLPSASEKRITDLFIFNGAISICRGFAWMMPKHMPKLKNYLEQFCRMWLKIY